MTAFRLLLIATVAACTSDDRAELALASVESAQAADADTTGQPDARLAKADLARIEGAPNAKAWLVIISDFQCPYCKQWHDSSSAAIRRDYVAPGKLRVAYINFPLGQHRNATPTAEAAMCAGLQDKFWPYHDALFASQQRWQDLEDATPVLDSLARAVGLDVVAHKACRSSHVMHHIILADRDRASRAGAQSTPTFLVGGQVLKGAYPLPLMRRILDAAVAEAAR